MLFQTHINKEYEEVSFDQLTSLIKSDSFCCLGKSRNREDLGIKNTVSENVMHFKPIGMYYSIGSDWLKFMNINRPHDMGSYLYDISFSDRESILVLNTISDIENFEKRFMATIPSSLKIEEGDLIDWERVCDEYDGIEINMVNYKGMKKWLSRWDVRQGCIWDPTCLNRNITLLAEKISDKKQESLIDAKKNMFKDDDYFEDTYSDEEDMPDWMREEFDDDKYYAFDKLSDLKRNIKKKSSIFSGFNERSIWKWFGYKNIL